MSSLIEIQNQIALLQKKAEEIKANEFAKAVEDILGKMDAYGITVDDLGRNKSRVRKAGSVAKSGSTAPVKFRGPNGETWSGRGLMPRWLAAQIADGKTREAFAV